MLPASVVLPGRPFSAGDFRVPTRYLSLLVGEVDGAALLQRAGISEVAGPDDRLPSITFMNLCLEHMRASGDESYGTAATPAPRGAFGLLMAAASQADRFGDALSRFAEAVRVIRPDVDVRVHLNRVRLQLSLVPLQESARHELMAEVFALSSHCAFRWLTGVQLRPLHLKICLPHPDFPRSILGVLGSPMLRRGRGVVLSYPASAASLAVLPVKYQHWAAQELGEFMRLLEEAAQRRNPVSATGKAPTILRVEELLARGVRDETETATHLGMSPASLRRRLKEGGQSFRSLLADARQRTAASLLATDKSLEDIAAELGFADTRSLRRACQQWFGMSPSDYRDRQAN